MYITDIFQSIDGEVCSFHQGRLTTFIRMAGCNLSCFYCDAKESQDRDNGRKITVEQIVRIAEKTGNKNVTITGGEPLQQRESFSLLLGELTQKGFYTSVETNGSIIIPTNYFFDRVSFVVDYKLDSTGYTKYMMSYHSLGQLSPKDWIKFVIAEENDFIQAVYVMGKLKNYTRARYAFSCVGEKINSNDLISWMFANKLYNCVFSAQIHKLINLVENKWSLLK